ncbi:diphosphomevalonate/mevalonate 3,5-bisphosphate decarboxylase family protein [Ichthyobacterium seriolicida]|uniref:Diphosphomevalonate decarboxylase n=1 Tax=Ichthyobacterium seriolicida TaxID=242600 RepID=A0A1J1E0N0_9FLAO|nr:diphosphomevalonate decarboxylase [Ichthyobacterium seriolicida]BAV94485.1 diphosphomevalonate decarboxylase [Ichthyobacterium seriolicida]
MKEKQFISTPTSYGDLSIDSGAKVWQSPSNIAIVKYWGKKPNQIPSNPSISFTLSNSYTKTKFSYARRNKKSDDKIYLKFSFDNKPKIDFEKKVSSFLERIIPYSPYLKYYDITIDTENSFPHSSGIASSASGMSAIALCIMSLERDLFPHMDDVYFYRKASFLSRLGSGSASRSVNGNLMIWGNHKDIDGSSDIYAITYPHEVHSVFYTFCDTILLIDESEKKISSSIGHKLMENHPFANTRFKIANDNISSLKDIFSSGDIESFGLLLEREALNLHAMMMCSQPYFLLIKPNTIYVIEKVWKYRLESKNHLYFTLDAGANVHLLYPKFQSQEIEIFIKDELSALCEQRYISDCVGNGAKQIF